VGVARRVAFCGGRGAGAWWVDGAGAPRVPTGSLGPAAAAEAGVGTACPAGEAPA
jgi:hypothetical protein